MPHDRHGDGSAGQGHAAHVERSYGESRQGSSDDHGGVSARLVGPDPPTQCTSVCLPTGRLHCDAGEGWRTGNTDTWTDLLRGPRRCSCRWPERKQHQAGEIPGALDQGQRRPGGRARTVIVRVITSPLQTGVMKHIRNGRQETNMSLDNTSQPSVKYCADKVNAKYIHGRPEPELVPSRYALKVGEIDVMVVSDGVLSLPGAMLGHNADPAARAAWLEDMFLPPDVLEWALNVVVVRSGGRTILIDVGIGADPDLNLPRAGRLIQRLQAA